MGLDYNTYVGPYVECRFEDKEIIEARRTCTNRECNIHSRLVWDEKTKFCSQCGAAIAPVDFKKIVPAVNDAELQDGELKNNLRTPCGDQIRDYQQKNHVHLWLSNLRSCGISIEYYETSIHEITSNMLDEQIKAFKKQFGKALIVLAKHYGEDNMTFKYGIFHWVS